MHAAKPSRPWRFRLPVHGPRSSWSPSRPRIETAMIPRYSRPEMTAIWSPENRYRIWFEIEALAAEGMARVGAIPEEAARTIREKGAPKLAAINADDIAQ